MEAIEVTARWLPRGEVIPLSFTWRGHHYPVESTGRRWQDEQGEHILAMTPEGRVYELVFQAAEKRWLLNTRGLPPAVV
jgi:hypothetical protein